MVRRAELPEFITLTMPKNADEDRTKRRIGVVLQKEKSTFAIKVVSPNCEEEGKVIHYDNDTVITRGQALALLPLPPRLDASAQCPCCWDELKTASGFPLKAHYWRGCCASIICESCFWKLWQNASNKSPRCPLCRSEMTRYDLNHVEYTEKRVARGDAFAAYALAHDLLLEEKSRTLSRETPSQARWYPDREQGMKCLRLSAALGYRWACADYACRLFDGARGPTKENLEACAILEALLDDDLRLAHSEEATDNSTSTTTLGSMTSEIADDISMLTEDEDNEFFDQFDEKSISKTKAIASTIDNGSLHPDDESIYISRGKKNSTADIIASKSVSSSSLAKQQNTKTTRSNCQSDEKSFSLSKTISRKSAYRDRLCFSLGLVSFQSADKCGKLVIPHLLLTAVNAFTMVSSPEAFNSVHRDVALIAIVAIVRIVQIRQQQEASNNAHFHTDFASRELRYEPAALLTYATSIRDALHIPADTLLPPPLSCTFDQAKRQLSTKSTPELFSV